MSELLSALNSSVLPQLQAHGDALATLLQPLEPYNPQPVFQHYWEAMCGRYTEYEIATYGSLLVQVIFYFGTSVPGFIFQFLAFMKRYKVQQVSQQQTGRSNQDTARRKYTQMGGRNKMTAAAGDGRTMAQWRAIPSSIAEPQFALLLIVLFSSFFLLLSRCAEQAAHAG